METKEIIRNSTYVLANSFSEVSHVLFSKKILFVNVICLVSVIDDCAGGNIEFASFKCK